MKSNVLKDKKIDICVKVETEDDDGFKAYGYMPIDDLGKKWAYYKQLSASLFFASHQTNVKEECFFRVNYNSYLKPNRASDLYVIYNNVLYHVTRVDDFEGYKSDISLYATYDNERNIKMIPFDKNLLP